MMADIIDFNKKDKSNTEPKQLHLDLGIPLEPPKDIEITKPEDASLEERKEVMQNNAPIVQPTIDTCIMPTTLQSAAQSSMSLRSVQQKLIDTITNGPYLELIAATRPEAIPNLIDSVNNSVAVSDNLIIQMAKVAEKNASMNRVFEYLTKKQESKSKSAENSISEETDEYKQSIDKIKTAIYSRLNKERDSERKTAQDFIDAEYTIKDKEDTVDIEDDFDDIEEEQESEYEVVNIDDEDFPIE